MNPDPRRDEWLKCSLSFPYWLDTHGQLYDATRRRWLRFRLWPRQREVAEAIAPLAVAVTAPKGEAAPRIPSESPQVSPQMAGAMHSQESPPQETGLLPADAPRPSGGLPRSASPLPPSRLF